VHVQSPSLMMSSRNAACRGCDECILGVSVVGVMIYDQMMPELPLKDHVQELKHLHHHTQPSKPRASPNGGPACSGNHHGPLPRATALRWQTDRESHSLFRHANSKRLPYAALLLGAKIVGVGRCVERR